MTSVETGLPSSPPDIFFSTFSLDDLCHNLENNEVSSATRVEGTGRKTWKTLKGKNEAVWPYYLEAALIEALQKYRPRNTRNTRLLARFPRRNRFISDYIFRLTGKFRTPKQVGSRLQQLRDTCSEEHILRLLSKREFTPAPGEECSVEPTKENHFEDSELLLDVPVLPFPKSPSTSSERFETPSPSSLQDTSSTSLPETLTKAVPLPTCTIPSVVVNLQLASQHSYNGMHPAPLDFSAQQLTSQGRTIDSSSLHHSSATTITTGERHVNILVPAPLDRLYPTVTFTCTSDLPPNTHSSTFYVFFGDILVHSEATWLNQLPGRSENGAFTYGTPLIPQYWSLLCSTANPVKYRIVQDISRVLPSGNTDTIIFSVRYQFTDTLSIPHSPIVTPPESLDQYLQPSNTFKPCVGDSQLVPPTQPYHKTAWTGTGMPRIYDEPDATFTYPCNKGQMMNMAYQFQPAIPYTPPMEDSWIFTTGCSPQPLGFPCSLLSANSAFS